MCIRHELDASQRPAPRLFSIRRLAGFTAAIAAGIFLAEMTARPAQAQDTPVTIRFSAQIRPGMPTYQSLQHFKDRVEQASNGSLAVEIHHSAQLFSDVQVGPAVTAGAVEMGYVNLSRYARTLPIADAFQLPFLFNTGEIVHAAIAPGAEIRALIEGALLKQAGSRVLWWVPVGQTVLLSNGSSTASPENIAGKTVRTFGPVTEALVRLCGGHPKDIGGQAQEKAYEKREVDVGAAGISSVAGRKLWRFMDTITRTNHASVLYVIVINEDYWQSLSAAQRNILAGAARAADAEARSIGAAIEANAYKELSEGQGVKIVSLTDDELRRWRICSSEVLEQFLETAGPGGQELMLAYGRLRKEAGGTPVQPSISPLANTQVPATAQ